MSGPNDTSFVPHANSFFQQPVHARDEKVWWQDTYPLQTPDSIVKQAPSQWDARTQLAAGLTILSGILSLVTCQLHF